MFGSVARNEADAESDIDILVTFRDIPVTFDAYMDVRIYLEDLLKTPVDLVIAESLHSRIKPFVQQDAVYVRVISGFTWKIFSRSCQRITRYTTGMSYSSFVQNTLVYDAVLRNIKIVGEAVKQVPREIRNQYSELDWRRIAGMRDIVAHHYFSIHDEIV